MKIDVLKHEKNPLMKREEVLLSVEHEGKATPARKDLLKEVAKKLKSKEELIIIDRIFTAPGKSRSGLKALLYKKKDDIPEGKLEKMKARMERKKKPAKEEPAKPEEKKEEAAKEEVAEEKPEAKPEEKIEEEKPEEEGEAAKEEAKEG